MSINPKLDILKQIIDKQQEKDELAKYKLHSDMYDLVIKTVKDKKLILYGGFALNILLPKKHRIYKPKTLPDVDCFSANAKEDAINIADLLYKQGYKFIEVKSAIHAGTYKVFAEFMPIADITQVSKSMFEYLTNNSVLDKNTGLSICPPEFLMWSLYKELARPEGSGFRWEKIFSRYIIFHKHHKFIDKFIDKSKMKCFTEDSPTVDKFADFIKEKKWPLIGQRAVSLYLNMECKPLENMYAFDIIVENIDEAFKEIQKNFESDNLTLKTHTTKSLKELTNKIGFVKHNNTRLCKLYETDSCYSFQKKQNFIIGSVDTVLHFLYANYMISTHFDKSDIVLVIQKLIINLEKYALTLDIKERFKIACYGYEKTPTNVKKENWFKKAFNYRPEKI